MLSFLKARMLPFSSVEDIIIFEGLDVIIFYGVNVVIVEVLYVIILDLLMLSFWV